MTSTQSVDWNKVTIETSILHLHFFIHRHHQKQSSRIFSVYFLKHVHIVFYSIKNGLKMTIVSFIVIISETDYRPVKFVIMTGLETRVIKLFFFPKMNLNVKKWITVLFWQLWVGSRDSLQHTGTAAILSSWTRLTVLKVDFFLDMTHVFLTHLMLFPPSVSV